MLTLAAGLALCRGAARADGRHGRRGGHANDVAVSTAAADDPEPQYGPTTLEDAQMNFETIVKTYVLKKSPGGYWPYEDANGRKWRLKYVSLDSASVKAAAAPGAFAAIGKLRDARSGRRVFLVFTVDFSGADWKVVAVAPVPAKAPTPESASAQTGD